MTRRLIVPCVVLAVFAFVVGATAEPLKAPVFVAANGEPGGRALLARAQDVDPEPAPYLGYSLTYDGFSGTCSAAGFSGTATGHYTLPTAVDVNGTTTLNSLPYDTFAFSLPSGTADFPTAFARTFTTAQPTANWTFVLVAGLTVGTTPYGTSITRITCTDGVLSGVNGFNGPIVIPTLNLIGLAALVLLVGGAAFFLLRQRT